MEHLTLSGSPFEIGVQHGLALQYLIPRVIEQMREPPEAFVPARTQVRQAILVSVERRTPNLVEELRGIAAGAGLPTEAVLDLNLLYDLAPNGVLGPTHCTAIGLPNTTEGPLVAKTDDVALAERSFETMFRLQPQEGYSSLHYAYAGTVWNQGGLNSAGLAIAMTGLPPIGPRRPDGLPSLLFLRLALTCCATVAEVLTLAGNQPLCSWGCTLTMADLTSGDITVVEDTPWRQAIRRENCQPTVRTNHPEFVEDQELAAQVTPAEESLATAEFRANSLARAERARYLTAQLPRSSFGLKQLLADHATPGGVCQHGAAGLHTSIAMIMLPQQRVLMAAEGYGCESYVEYTL
jgi:isopenicillin-N N-acyltransferase-like protein